MTITVIILLVMFRQRHPDDGARGGAAQHSLRCNRSALRTRDTNLAPDLRFVASLHVVGVLVFWFRYPTAGAFVRHSATCSGRVSLVLRMGLLW